MHALTDFRAYLIELCHARTSWENKLHQLSFHLIQPAAAFEQKMKELSVINWQATDFEDHFFIYNSRPVYVL